LQIPTCTANATSSSAMAERTVWLWCTVPTPEKFKLQLSAVVIRQAGPVALHRTCLFMSRGQRFSKGGGSLSVNIWHGRGHRPPTSVGVRKLGRLPFRVVWNYLQCII